MASKRNAEQDDKIVKEAQERPSVEMLRAMLVYNPELGTLRWGTNEGRHIILGNIAGSQHPSGYIRVGLLGRCYPAHSIAWAMMYGAWQADDLQIDHINGIKNDNRASNLRLSTPSQNQSNQTRYLKGVRLHRCGKWEARIRFNGKSQYIGLFATSGGAKLAYDSRAKSLFGEFART